MAPIRRLRPEDFSKVVEVYRDAVISQATGLYSPAQIQAWAEHAGRDHGFRETLQRGYGLVSCDPQDLRRIEAFALLDPGDRLSLLYCRGSAARQGRATALVRALECHARRCGCHRLRTEASQLSRPLFEKLGWQIDGEEVVPFAGVRFRRWRMIRALV